MAGKNVTSIATPGAAAPAEPPAQTAGALTPEQIAENDRANEALVNDDPLPPDLQAKVDAAVERGIAQGLQRALGAINVPAKSVLPKDAPLPKYEDVEREQLAKAPADRESVLTDKGWFVAEKPLPPNANKF